MHCAVEDQSRPRVSSFATLATKGPIHFNEDGTYTDRYGFVSEQIGWYVPAVPYENRIEYCGYFSIPKPGLDWWKQIHLISKNQEVNETKWYSKLAVKFNALNKKIVNLTSFYL